MDLSISSYIKHVHFTAGFLGVVMFLYQGHYMDSSFIHLKGVDGAAWMQIRALQVSTLLISIINLVMGIYTNGSKTKIEFIRLLISSFLILSLVLVVIGFFVEPVNRELERPFSYIAMYGLFIISLLLIITGLIRMYKSFINNNLK